MAARNMSPLAKPVAPSTPEIKQEPSVPWVSLAWFGALLLLCYAPVLAGLVRQWNNDEDMGHGFFVPAVAGYIAWLKRDEFVAARTKYSYLGLALVLFASLQLWPGPT